jgi:hypothetical protein
MLRSFLLALLLFPLFAYGIEFTFPTGSGYWKGDFTDYPVNEEKFYELAWGWENLPTPVASKSGPLLKKGLFLSGNNHSDDLFMFVKRKIEGLKPNTLYGLDFSLLIESAAAAGSVGIGGSPGESVYIKVGGSTEEPRKVAIDGFYHLSVDKGDQAQSGQNALVIGNLANERVDPNAPTYHPKELRSETLLPVKSDEKGELWVFLGTDSGFEGSTKFYIAQISLQLEELPAHAVEKKKINKWHT